MTKEEIIRKKKIYEWIQAIGILLSVTGFLSFTVNPYMGFVVIGFGIVLTIIAPSMFKKLSNSYKESYVKEAILSSITNATYDPQRGFSKEEVYNAGVLLKQDRFSSEDMITGYINDHYFRCADVHLQDVRSNGKTTTVVTIFKGRYYEITTERIFPEPIHILNNNTTLFGKRNSLEKIELEWIDFNKMFDVFSSSQFETFKLLKPNVMEQIVHLKRKYNKLVMGFIGNKVILAINNQKDAFDLKMFRPFNDHYIKEIKDEFKELEEMISVLENILN